MLSGLTVLVMDETLLTKIFNRAALSMSYCELVRYQNDLAKFASSKNNEVCPSTVTHPEQLIIGIMKGKYHRSMTPKQFGCKDN